MPIITNKNKTACPLDKLFVSAQELESIAFRYPTPFYLFDEDTIIRSIAETRNAFPFCGHFVPVSVCRQRKILRLLRQQGVGVLCSSPAELQLAISCGFSGKGLRYAAVLTDDDVAARLRDLDATLLLSSPLTLPRVLPKRVDFLCYVPHMSNAVLAPANLKHTHLGIKTEEIAVLASTVRRLGAESLGLAMPSGDKNLKEEFLAAKAEALLSVAEELHTAAEISVDRLYLGGGLGLEYHRTRPQPDAEKAAALLQKAIAAAEQPAVDLALWQRMMEPTALLVTSVLGAYERSRQTVAVNVSSHETIVSHPEHYRYITVPGKEWIENRVYCDVIGSRGDRCDWLTRQAIIPQVEAGELLVFQDTGCCVPPMGTALCLLRSHDGTVTEL